MSDFTGRCQAYTLDEAVAERIFPGNPPSRQTVFRWCTAGCRGVRLEHMRIGKKICITADAVEKFGKELAAAWERPQSPTTHDRKPRRKNTPSDRERALQAARQTLQENGVL